jgi:dGTP triphosphohydrolase
MEPYLREHPTTCETTDVVSLLKDDDQARAQIVTDYIASMTDRMALQVAASLIMPHIYV